MISFSIKAALPPAAVPWQRRCFRRRWPGSTERASSLWSSRCAPQAAVAADQVVGGTIVAELGGGLALQLRDNALRQYLAQFDAPLIEGIDIPDHALGEYAVLVEGDQLSQRCRRQPLHQNGVGWSIAFEHAVRNKPIRRAFGLDLLARFSKGEGLGLRKDVRQQHIVMPSKRVERLCECDEVTRNEPRSLLHQLLKEILSVRSLLPPLHRPY